VSIRQDTLRTLVFQFLMLAAGMVTNIVVARTLGPEGKGLLSFLRYALFVTINLGGLGLHAAAIQHIGKRRFPPPTIAATQIVLALALGAICAAAMALILPLYRDKMELQPAVWLSFLPVLVVSLVHLNLSGVLVGLGRIRDDNVIRLLSPLAWMTGAVVVLALLRGDKTAGALTWIAAQSVSAVAAILWIWIVARPRFVRLAGCARASLRFGFEVYLANLVWTLLLRADTMLLGYMGGAGALGIYSISVLFAELIWYLSRALTIALSPRIAAASREESMALTQRAARVAVWAAVAAAAGLLIAVRPAILIVFGRAFLPALTPFFLLLPGIVLGTLASPLSLYFTQQRGLPRVNALISGAGLVVNVALNLVWIPRHGAAGAAAASSVAYGLVAALLLWRFSREPGFRLGLLLRPQRDDLRLLVETVRAMGAALRPSRGRGDGWEGRA